MCNHLESYDLYTRVLGYSLVRVYHCHSCGAHLAMDTLPQQLYKRMYPLPESKVMDRQEASKLPPVDLCVVLGGPNVSLLSRMCLWSLNRTATTFQGVTFHLVNRGIPEDEFNQVCKMIPGCKQHTRPPIPDWMMQRAKRRMFPIGDDLLGLDAEWTYKWMTENCGNNRYVVLSHFDIFFTGDFLNRLRSSITPKTGMLGQHCPFMLISREAFSQSYFGYRSEGPFYGVLLKNEPKQFHLYYPGDPRITPDALQTGFDNGELLELELRMLGWETNPLREEFDNHFYHFTGGDRVHNDPEFTYMRERARMFIEEWNIPECPQVDVNK